MSNQKKAQNRTERMFALAVLLQTNPNMNARALAQHFGVTRRTIFRDLRALAESGMPLHVGEDGYRVAKGYRLPPLMFSEWQAIMLLVGLECMKLQSDASLSKEADEVALRIRSMLPDMTREYIDLLTEHMVLDPYWEGVTEKGGYWKKLGEALLERRSVLMKYRVESRDEMTQRTVNPLGLVFYDDHWTLVAYDCGQNSIRSFRLKNIDQMMVLSEKFTPPEKGFDLNAYLNQSTGERVVIRVDTQAFYQARRRFPALIESESQEGSMTEIIFHFDSMDYLAHWLLRFGAAAQVQEPESLRRKVQEEAQVLARMYDSEGD